MKILNKFLATLIAICMTLTLMPVLYVPVSAEPISVADSIKGRCSTVSEVPDTYSGQVWRLEKSDNDKYDYSITVSVQNITGSMIYTGISFKDSDVLLTNSTGKTDYSDIYATNQTSFFRYAKLTTKMTSQDLESMDNTSLNGTIFQTATANESEMTLVDGYYQLRKTFLVDQALDDDPSIIANWNSDEEGGAKYGLSLNGITDSYTYLYATPEKELCDLYTIYFKAKSADKTLNEDTFTPFTYRNLYTGGCTSYTLKGSLNEYVNNQGVYMVGFPAPKAKSVNAQFTVKSGSSALTGATVDVFSDSARQDKVGTATTAADGTASVELPECTDASGKTYYYTATCGGYQTVNDSFTIKTSDVPVSVAMSAEAEAKYDLVVTVKDADTGDPVQDASIAVASQTQPTKTNADGKLTVSVTAGNNIAVSASKSGYTTNSAAATVTSSGGSVTIELVPTRVNITMPQVTADGSTISNAKVVIKKTSTNTTKEWGTEKECSPNTSIALPANSRFMVSVSAAGYNSATYYIETDGSAAKVYSDPGYSTEFTGDMTIAKMQDPYYNVEVTETSQGSGVYKAVVSLHNINAGRGAFGLKYDKDVFDFNPSSDFEFNSAEVHEQPLDTGSGNLPAICYSDQSGTIAYHAFTWEAENMVLDATAGGKTIATYTFRLKANKTANDISTSAFSVMPYDKTNMAVQYFDAAGKSSEARAFLNDLWRYCDSQNNASSLGDGRLEDSKATAGGFFQVFANPVTASDYVGMSDVITQFDFDAAVSALEFEAVDDYGAPVSGVKISLTGHDNKTLTTDGTGIASTAVDASAGDVTYNYSVNCDGYWSVQGGMVTIPSTPLQTVYVKLNLNEKIYHPIIAKDNDGTVITGMTFSGGPYAYNNHSYSFNVTPQLGSMLNGHPNLTAVIEGTEITVPFNTATNTYNIPAGSIVGSKINQTADANGFLGNDIIIKVPKNDIVESNDKFIARAIAGSNGDVTYASTNNVTTVTDPKTITVSELSPGDSTDEFTFTASDGFMVESVYINGSEVTTYNNEKQFTYKFENVSRDNTIVVKFWNGKEHSTDSVVTISVGDRGSASVTNPSLDTALTPIKNGARTYLYKNAGTFEFNTAADAGYTLASVEERVNGAAKTDVSGSAPYSVNVAASQNIVVYVSFKLDDPDAEPFTVFVKSYVKKGKGMIDEVGVLPYNKNECPTFTMTPYDTDSKAVGVDIDGTETIYQSQKSVATYTFEPLDKDREIGAIFGETAYHVHGLIDFSQKKTLASNPIHVPAEVIFTRNDGEVVKTLSTCGRTDATFDADLAEGTWTLVVKKRGYLDYTITDFVVTKDGSTIYFGASGGSTSAKPIVPYIGDTTGDGAVVSLSDAGVVGSSLRTGVNDAILKMGDVDDDQSTNINDMTYIKENYGLIRIKQTYNDFCTQS